MREAEDFLHCIHYAAAQNASLLSKYENRLRKAESIIDTKAGRRITSFFTNNLMIVIYGDKKDKY